MKSQNVVFFLILFLASFLAGCASVPFAPHYLDPSFSTADVDSITILPVADLRKDKSAQLGEDWENRFAKSGTTIYWTTERTFKKKKGFDVTFESDYGGVESVSEDDLLDTDPAWVKKLGPEKDRWILLLALEDTVSKVTFGKAFAIECSAIFYDKKSGKAVWKHKATREVGQGGLGAFLVPDKTVLEDQLRFCLHLDILYYQFPKKK